VWASAISQADIAVTDGSDDLELVMAKSYSRRLSHKGIEFEGLFFNSNEVQSLRTKYGDKVDVEIRVDEDNLGSIRVLDPKLSDVYVAKAVTYFNNFLGQFIPAKSSL
jgi:putative transposase